MRQRAPRSHGKSAFMQSRHATADMIIRDMHCLQAHLLHSREGYILYYALAYSMRRDWLLGNADARYSIDDDSWLMLL